MMKYFFDTSVLIKLYHAESGDEMALAIYYSENEIFISELSIIEFVSTMYRKFRNKEINARILKIAIDRFISDFDDKFHVIPLASSLTNAAFDLITDYGRTKHIISLDAIQIASFITIADDDIIFVSADNRLNNFVREMLFNVLEWDY